MFYSIVIPVYNRKDELIAICDSLSKQTLKSFEIIVVDDGSIDSVEPVCLDFKDRLTIKYIYKYTLNKIDFCVKV